MKHRDGIFDDRRADLELAATKRTCRRCEIVAFSAVAVLLAVLVWKVLT